MAPPKNKSDGEGKGKAVATTPSKRTTRSMVRKTRSDTRRSGSASKLVSLDSPEKKKRKTQAKKGEPSKKIKKEEEEEEEEEEAVEVKTEEEDDDAAAEEEAEEEEDDSGQKKIVIEHCKQCKSFRERAAEVKEGLEIAVPGIVVTVNPDKPRRGCFEIREEGGEAFVSLLDMKRPFTPMKELDMDKVIADIVEKIK